MKDHSRHHAGQVQVRVRGKPDLFRWITQQGGLTTASLRVGTNRPRAPEISHRSRAQTAAENRETEPVHVNGYRKWGLDFRVNSVLLPGCSLTCKCLLSDADGLNCFSFYFDCTLLITSPPPPSLKSLQTGTWSPQRCDNLCAPWPGRRVAPEGTTGVSHRDEASFLLSAVSVPVCDEQEDSESLNRKCLELNKQRLCEGTEEHLPGAAFHSTQLLWAQSLSCTKIMTQRTRAKRLCVCV